MELNEINKLPKVELHLHLDGSFPLEIISKISNYTVTEAKEKMVAKDKCINLKEYLTKFDLPISLMQDGETLFTVASSIIEKLISQNVIYAEIRFAPMFHTKKGLSYDDVVQSVLKATINSKIKVNLILCMMRGASDVDNLKTIETAKKYLNNGVCAIDLAGDEANYPTRDYSKFFDIAKKLNIPFTIHAGEAKGASEVEYSIKAGAKRIGHGIHCIEDEKTVKMVVENDVLLEVCPTSNVQTNAVNNYVMHPIKKLYDIGVKVCINTDNSTVSNISITEEYLKLHKTFNFDINDFKIMNINAIEHAFISEIEKEELKRKLNKKMDV